MPVKKTTVSAKKSNNLRRYPYRRRRVTGKGGYWYVSGDANISGNIPKIGQFGASASGGYANKQVSRDVVSGKGEYTIKRNVLYEGAQMPEVVNPHRDDGAVVVRHSEYICDVISSSTAGAFNVQSFPINAGIAQTFEYLAQIAGNFTEYKIEGMIFEFRTRSVDALNSTNTALGSVYIATQYNSLEPNFSSKAEMSSYMYCNNCKPSESMYHIIECDPRQTSLEHLYIRTGNVPSGADIRMYDIGRLQIATQGMQAASVNIGELHVTYQCSLYKARLYQSLGYLNDCQVFYNASASVQPANPLGNGGISASLPSNWTEVINNMPLSSAGGYMMATNGASGRIRLRAPRYPMGVRLLYEFVWVWSVAKTQDVTAPTFALLATGAGATDLTSTYYPGSSYSTPPPGVSSTVWTARCVIDYVFNVDPCIELIYSGTFPTDTAGVYITISQLPNSS